MPVEPVPQQSLQPITTLGIVTSAMREVGILDASEPPDGADGEWGLEKLQRLIDRWNAIREAIYSVNFTVFTLIANHAPHTIGPTGDFVVSPRPVNIVAASFILNAGQGQNQVDSPQINIRDAEWWAALPTKQLQNSIVTDLYYEPSTPLGTLNFWPICNIANPVRLEMWTSILTPVALSTQLSLPQGYWDALVLTLAVELCSSYGTEPKPTLAQRQKEAVRAIFGNNAHPPRIRTDSAMPSAPHTFGRPDFNFLTGLRE